MNTREAIKDIVVPLLSAFTAIIVGILTYNVSDQNAKTEAKFKDTEARFREIESKISESKEQREERESTQNFNFKIYDLVLKSVEEKNAQKQEVAKTFIVVMVDDPLRSSLLKVLEKRGEPQVRQDVEKTLNAEKNSSYTEGTKPTVSGSKQPSYNWAKWDIDVFWCSSSSDKITELQANKIAKQILLEGAKGRIRVKELPDSINAKSGYRVNGYVIRRNDIKREREIAEALKKLGDSTLGKDIFTLQTTLQDTPGYVSVFVCPGR